MAEMHTHRGNGVVFCETSLPLCFVLPESKFFPGLYNFPDTHTIPVVTPPAYALHVDKSPVWNATHTTHVALPLRITCVLFTLGSMWTSRYATQATHMAFLLGRHPVYPRKHMHILLHYVMSKEFFCCYRILPMTSSFTYNRQHDHQIDFNIVHLYTNF